MAGQACFIRHRTEDEIARASATDMSDLRDPESDQVRAEKPDYLVLVGVCTHLGCVPLGQKTGEVRGDYDGWFALAMGLTMTLQVVFAKIYQQTLRFHRTLSSPKR